MLPTRRQALLLGAAAALAHRGAAAAGPLSVPGFAAAPTGSGIAADWKHQGLPKVERRNTFDIVADAGRQVLRVRSSSSASSLLARPSGQASPKTSLQWQWKVSRAVAGSDVTIKQGDDYAARLYVLFDLPSSRLSLADRLRLQAARALSGAELPAAGLCYVWGRAQAPGITAWNPYSDRLRMIVVDSGDALAMQWRTVRRDLRRDWDEAFGGSMPPISAVAVGADTDNTGESVEAWFSDIVFSELS
ncbi:MAG: DUF3047 domain-containing protein [Pseudomonadota bacterium]